MSLVVKYTIVNKKTQRVTFRRIFPLDVREITGWAYKVPLGMEGSPGLLSRWEKAASDYEAALDRARRQLAGKYDQLDSPTIAYLAETFRVESIADDDAGRWSGEERELPDWREHDCAQGVLSILYQSMCFALKQPMATSPWTASPSFSSRRMAAI